MLGTHVFLVFMFFPVIISLRVFSFFSKEPVRVADCEDLISAFESKNNVKQNNKLQNEIQRSAGLANILKTLCRQKQNAKTKRKTTAENKAGKRRQNLSSKGPIPKQASLRLTGWVDRLGEWNLENKTKQTKKQLWRDWVGGYRP